MIGVVEAPEDGAEADRGVNEEGDSNDGGVHANVLGDVHTNVLGDVQGGVPVTTLGGENIKNQGVHTNVKLGGMEGSAAMKDQATTKELENREGGGIPDRNNSLKEVQPIGPPDVANAVTSYMLHIPNALHSNDGCYNALSSNSGCRGKAELKVDYARKTIENAKEILRNSDQCVMREPKLDTDELNDMAKFLHNKDGEIGAVGHLSTRETNDLNMAPPFESSNSSLPFIIKGMSETLDYILSIDKTKNKKKNELIQVVQNAHMLLRSNYNLVLKCNSNLSITVKKIRRLYRLYRKLSRSVRMSRKEQTVVVDDAPDVLPSRYSDKEENHFVGGIPNDNDHSTKKGGNLNGQGEVREGVVNEGVVNEGVDKVIEGDPTQGNDKTIGSAQGEDKGVQRNICSSVPSSVGCGYSYNLRQIDPQVDPPCGDLNPALAKEKEKDTLFSENPPNEEVISGTNPHEILMNGETQQEEVAHGTVDANQGGPYTHLDEITVKNCDPRDTQGGSNCVGKEDCSLSSKKKLSYAFVKGEEEDRHYKNLTSIESKSTAMSNRKEDAESSIETEERKKKKNTQRNVKGEKANNAESVEKMHSARSLTKEQNKNKKKEREKKKILRQLSKLNSLFFLTFNHKGDIINYLHREIRSSISEFDAAYQLYVSK